MPSFIDTIISAQNSYTRKTNVIPTNVYLGTNELKQLHKWALTNGYTEYSTVEEFKITDYNRPEIHGLFVYIVNDKSHMRFS